MKRYNPGELERFLVALDQHLAESFTMIIIEGCAAALAYKTRGNTQDIDTMNDVSEIQDAYKAAKKETGLNIPLGPAGVADAPYGYEARLEELKLHGMSRLKILVPEKHDLVLMKIIRGYEHDLATIKEMADRIGLELETLLERFQSEMSHVTCEPSRLELNFLVAVERVYGEEKAVQVEKRLKRRVR